jgi:long-subunit acyl-CoA synthetase (AMP-forming)
VGVHQEFKKRKVGKLPHLRIVVGGSAVPPALVETYYKEYGIHFVHIWGMTETHPVRSVKCLIILLL